jgi:hypothetical protein
MRRREIFLFVSVLVASMTLLLHHSPMLHDSVDHRRLSALETQLHLRHHQSQLTRTDDAVDSRLARLEANVEELRTKLFDQAPRMEERRGSTLATKPGKLQLKGQRELGFELDVMQQSDEKQPLKNSKHLVKPYDLGDLVKDPVPPFVEVWNETDPFSGKTPLSGGISPPPRG